MDVMELERNIKYVLGELEKDTYVQRVGDTYNYLTNEEQDIEQEVKSTDIDSSKEIDELKKILVSDVLGKMTVHTANSVPSSAMVCASMGCNSPRNSPSG